MSSLATGLALLAAVGGGEPVPIDNPYLPMKPGSRWVYRETGTDGTVQRVVVKVTHRTKLVATGVRARVVREPRAVLREMGCDVPEGKRIEVWDSSAEVRYLVLPQQPAGTEGWDAEALIPLVTRDAMVGVATVAAP